MPGIFSVVESSILPSLMEAWRGVTSLNIVHLKFPDATSIRFPFFVTASFLQFTDITQVPMPPIYEKFLSFIGIFTFDLGWIFSAACLTDGINFYDQLL